MKCVPELGSRMPYTVTLAVRCGCRPKEPPSLAELHLEEEWTETGGNNPRPFLIHDSGADAND